MKDNPFSVINVASASARCEQLCLKLSA